VSDPIGEQRVAPSPEVVKAALRDALRLHDTQLRLLSLLRLAQATGDAELACLLNEELHRIRDQIEPIAALSDLANGR
jgi:hypothetical protein